MHAPALSCGLLLFHSEPPLSSNPPMRFGPGFFECGHTRLAPPTQDNPPNMFPASRAPSNTCTCPHATLWGTQCPHLCHALHTGDLGHALTNLGPSEPKKHIAVCWCSLRQQRRPGSAVTQQAQDRSLWKVSLWPRWPFHPRGAADSACVKFHMDLFHPIRWCLHIQAPACGIQSVSPGRATPDPVQGANWDRDS